MYRTILVILLGFLTVNLNKASVQVPQPDEDDIPLRGIDNEKLDQIQLPKDQVALVRLPSNTLLKYTAYKDVSILHFRIPPDTRTALFTFKAYEESKSAFQRVCQPRDVTLHLKAGSYPVISPENITFPRNFLGADQRFKIFNLQFESNGRQQRLSVDGPQAGNWFAVAFISWTDPNNERIEQQGLAASCETLLLSEMSVSRILPIILQSEQTYNNTLKNANTIKPLSTNSTNNSSNNTMNPGKSRNIGKTNNISTVYSNENDQNLNKTTRTSTATTGTTLGSGTTKDSEINSYKFYVPRNVGIVTARLIIASICLTCPDIGFYVQANALPSDTNFIHSAIIKPNQTGAISFEFYVQSGEWHFIDIKFLKHQVTSNTESTSSSKTTASSSGSTSSTITTQNLNEKHNPSHFDNYNSNINSNASIDISTNRTSIDMSKHHNYNWKNINNSNDNIISSSVPSVGSQGALRHSFNENNAALKISDDPLLYKVDYSIELDYHIENESVNSNNKNNNSNNENYNNSEEHTKKSIKFRNIEFYPLLRQTYREFFMFDYDLIPDTNGTVPTLLNLTAGQPIGFRFEVGDVYDIGGTLSFGLSMKRLDNGNKTNENDNSNNNGNEDIKNGIIAEKLVDRSFNNNGDINNDDIELYSENSINDNENNNAANDDKQLSSTPRSNQTIIICMRLGEPGEPKWPDKCRYGGKLLPASGIINNTDAETSTGLIHVPFPESGQWYITVGLFCHGAETTARVTIIDSVKEFVKKYSKMLDSMKLPCSCANFTEQYKKCIDDRKCFQQMNETETLKIKECLMDSKCTDDYIDMTKKFEIHHKFATEQSVATDSSCNTSLVFTISSSPCVAGRCGRYGRCYHYMSGGFVFSTCLCIKGYRGWDCTEDSQVPSSISILIASLLLTLSNLLFIPSIYFAVKRKYYTESVIYFFAMFFSIFYHACDSGEDEYSFCLVKINVLQFCDFYCGLLAIWVTLIAMAHIRQQFVSLLHMIGAIVLAFGTELNKQSLWVFLAPALTGLCLISVSWGMRCRKTRKWFPSRKYLTIYMPIGAVLVMIGLVCYAFLQTKQNYHIVHSVWHMVMALSLLCLLPSRNSFLPKC